MEIFSYSLTRDWGLAEDAVQDAFVILYKKQGALGDNDNVYGWMKKIVRDKSVDIIRKRSRFTNYDSSLLDLVEKSFEQHEQLLHKERLKSMSLVLEDCIKFLDSDDAEILKSFYLEKNRCDVIVKKEKLSVNAIRLKLSRLRNKLRRYSELKLSLLEGEA